MRDQDLIERIAVLEAKDSDILKTLKEILEEQKAVRGEINKYKGFIGSVWFVISCVGIFFSAFKFFHK